MSCLPTRPALLASPILDQKAVQDLQVLLDNEIPWLDVIYPIARVGITKIEGGGTFNYPQVYSGSGAEYLDIRPDDSLSAYSFFEVNESFPVDADEDLTNYNLSLIVWFNLPKLNGSKGYDYSRELAGDILRVFNESLYSGKISGITLDFNPEDIFDKYSLQQEDTQFLMYPYGAFKINFNYEQLEDIDCFTVFATGSNGCEN